RPARTPRVLHLEAVKGGRPEARRLLAAAAERDLVDERLARRHGLAVELGAQRRRPRGARRDGDRGGDRGQRGNGPDARSPVTLRRRPAYRPRPGPLFLEVLLAPLEVVERRLDLLLVLLLFLLLFFGLGLGLLLVLLLLLLALIL